MSVDREAFGQEFYALVQQSTIAAAASPDARAQEPAHLLRDPKPHIGGTGHDNGVRMIGGETRERRGPRGPGNE